MSGKVLWIIDGICTVLFISIMAFIFVLSSKQQETLAPLFGILYRTGAWVIGAGLLCALEEEAEISNTIGTRHANRLQGLENGGDQDAKKAGSYTYCSGNSLPGTGSLRRQRHRRIF